MTVKLTANDITKILGKSKQTLTKMIKNGEFPKADETSPGKPSLWYDSTVEQFIDSSFQAIEQPKKIRPTQPLEDIIAKIESSHERVYNPYVGHEDYVAPTN